MQIKKQLVFLFSFITALSSAAISSAEKIPVQENIYFKTNSLNNKESVHLVYHPMMGKNLFGNIRFEEKISYSFNNTFNSMEFMTNAFYDFTKISYFKPYLGVGAGVHIQSENTTRFDSDTETSDTIPSYQVMTGVLYESPKHPSIKLHLGYSYTSTSNNLTTDNELYDEYEELGGHNIVSSVKILF